MKHSDPYKLFTEYFGDHYTHEKSNTHPANKRKARHIKTGAELKAVRLHHQNKKSSLN